MFKKLVYPIALFLCSQTVFAKSEVVFSCFTNKGKHLSILQEGNFYEYSFGKPGKPELVFRNSIREVEARSEAWKGAFSRYMWTEYHMKNGKYSYIVRHSIDLMSDEHEQSGGLEVIKAGKTLTSLDCVRF